MTLPGGIRSTRSSTRSAKSSMSTDPATGGSSVLGSPPEGQQGESDQADHTEQPDDGTGPDQAGVMPDHAHGTGLTECPGRVDAGPGHPEPRQPGRFGEGPGGVDLAEPDAQVVSL